MLQYWNFSGLQKGDALPGGTLGVDSRLFCAVDIGSNSVRHLLALPGEGACGVVVAEFARLNTRLLARLDPRTGELGEADAEFLASAVGGVVDAARSKGCRAFAVAATHAFRRMANAAQVCGRIGRRTGLDVQVLPERREGSLAYRGALSALGVEPGRAAMIDVGGGSSELVCGAPGDLKIFSLPFGAVGVLGWLENPQGPMPAAQLEWLRAVLDERIGAGLDPDFPRPGAEVIGVGGSATTLVRLLNAAGSPAFGGPDTPVVDVAQIRTLANLLAGLPVSQRCRRYGLEADRADIIVPGLVIWETLAGRLGFDRVRVSRHGVCMGLVQEHFSGA